MIDTNKKVNLKDISDITPYHAKYFANVITHKTTNNNIEKLSMSLFDASVDINPHQVDAALFVFKSPLSKGVILADEVGLGKTIEAGLVLCQYWAERKRRLLIICPSSLRKQWSLELLEKFNLPNIILESKNYSEEIKNGKSNPFNQECIVITSLNFAHGKKNDIKEIAWDLVVVDEAHKLRNVYRTSNKTGQGIKWAIDDRKKILLTATPLQNSLLELYGLSTIVDEHIFGDLKSFRANYVNDNNLEELRERLQKFCKRTLRKDVLEYIKYTERHPLTQPFKSSNEEQELYNVISLFLQREDTYAIPKSQRILTTLILRKLLASSTKAVEQTLVTIRDRLLEIKNGAITIKESIKDLIDEDELSILEENQEDAEFENENNIEEEKEKKGIDIKKLDNEIEEVSKFIAMANEIKVDTKSNALLVALKIGFDKMNELGANRKALIFTESRRTQDYLKNFLETNGYKNKVVIFNGTNSGIEAKEIYDKWIEKNHNNGRISGSKVADKRNALIEYFRDEAEIMIATESAAEGVNLQFCSLIVNYDLPWNPQRIEQRIGRCHRYGQKFDVVVINFINERNEADLRVYELLNEKFNLFNGVLGSSDEVIGTVESGLDFERSILNIYQTCRTTKEIEVAFANLQNEMEEKINLRMNKTKENVLQNFDIDVHERLKFNLENAKNNLNKYEKLFWNTTKFVLNNKADFNNYELSFNLLNGINRRVPVGKYYMISKERENIAGNYLYRLSHPLGEYVLDEALNATTPYAKLLFDITNNKLKITSVEKLKGKTGYLILSKLVVKSFEEEEHLLFSGFTSEGVTLDQELCEKLFQCNAMSLNIEEDNGSKYKEKLIIENTTYSKSVIKKVMEENNKYFREEQERLQKWADDLILSSEKELEDVKHQIRELTRKAKMVITTEEQRNIQIRINELEKQKKNMRRKIFDVEDEVIEQRNKLIEELEKRMNQETNLINLFIIEWEVI